MTTATKKVNEVKKNHNKQTYLSKEDRIFIMRCVDDEINKIMNEKLTPQSIRQVANLQDLKVKVEAKLNN